MGQLVCAAALAAFVASASAAPAAGMHARPRRGRHPNWPKSPHAWPGRLGRVHNLVDTCPTPHDAMAMCVDSNASLARDLVFRVKLDSTASVRLDAVTQWLTTAVGKLYPVPDCFECDYPCALVSGTLHNDWADEEANDTVQNQIIAVAHRMWGPAENCLRENSRMKGLVVVQESAKPIDDQHLLDPRNVASALRESTFLPVPAGVVAVGVSGVSYAYAKMVWAEIVTPSRNWMDGEGKGYMVHPMFMFTESVGYDGIREMSFNFGWGDLH